MKIFVIAGKSRSGKDLLAQYMKEIYNSQNKKVCFLRFAKPLYDYAKDYFGWDGNLDNKPRELLQNLGYDVIQKQLGKKYFLVDRVIEDIEILNKYFDIFIITDGRLVSEFDRISEKYPSAKFVHVFRENFDNELSDIEKKHITENDFIFYKNFDYTINNKDKEVLYQDAKKIILDEECDNNE